MLALFAWLLWGDFCYTLMEAVVPSILPLKLKSLDCPNWLMGLILSTLPGILNTTICPYVSFKSDRYRSKWGRRIPFIICTVPFLCVSLALLGWSDEIGVFLQAQSPFLREFTPTTTTICLIGVFMAVFQFFNMFVGSVFWYLFNDVVPAQFLARFVGAFRIVGTGAGALYNYFIFQFAESNMREIFLGAAILYFIGFTMLCLFVKEGEYPPVAGEADKDNKGWGGIKTFLKESFTNKFYWLIFLTVSFQALAACGIPFQILFFRDMGLNLKDVGQMNAIGGIAALAAMYFTAIFVDRWHPMRTGAYMAVFSIIGNAMYLVWPFVDIPAKVFFWLSLATLLLGSFQTALAGASSFPLLMRVFPQSRFGQFCSAQALLRSCFTMVGGIGVGVFIDLVKWLCHGSDYAYRFNYIWMLAFSLGAAIIYLWAYLDWHKLGGDNHYHPPAAWNESGIEELPIVPSVGPQSKWLNIALHLFNALILLSALLIVPMLWWMRHEGAMDAFFWHLWALLPLSILLWAIWKWLEGKIRTDMRREHEGLSHLFGIPHHGPLLVAGLTFLLELAVWIAQIIVTVHMKNDASAIAFGAMQLVVNTLIIACILVLAKIELGRSIPLDTMTGRVETKG